MCIGGSNGGRGVGHLPILLMILMVITLLLTYMLAVYRKDVDPLFPYISDAGAKRPESCVFGQLLNFAAFLGFLVIFLRYRLVQELSRNSDIVLTRLNGLAFFFGIMSVFGTSIVGNFQVTDVIIVHLVGAFMCFISGLLYAWLQVALCYRMYPLYNGLKICRIRLSLAIVATMAFIFCLATGIISSVYRHDGSNSHGLLRLSFTAKGDPGYDLHLASAFSEWILIIMTSMFLLTYAGDFEKLRVFLSVEPLVNHLDEVVGSSSLYDGQRLVI